MRLTPPCLTDYYWAFVVVSAALRISRVTASGCATIEAWEAGTSSICAFPRPAMNHWPRRRNGPVLGTPRYHDGIDRHPGGPEGVPYPAPLQGRSAAGFGT